MLLLTITSAVQLSQKSVEGMYQEYSLKSQINKINHNQNVTTGPTMQSPIHTMQEDMHAGVEKLSCKKGAQWR